MYTWTCNTRCKTSRSCSPASRIGPYTNDVRTRSLVGTRCTLCSPSSLDLRQLTHPNAQLEIILGRFGTFIVERAGSDVDEALESLTNINASWGTNIYVLRQMIHNDVSSTKIRMFLRRSMSVHYLLPDSVIRYIEQHHLYVDDHKNRDRAAALAAARLAAEAEQKDSALVPGSSGSTSA